MKKLICAIILAISTCLAYGQNSGPLKFLGIPIDGSPEQFASKLKQKDFKYNSYTKSYQGQFNGKPVDVFIHTNHGIVDRVYVSFPETNSEATIRNEFNRLLSQFKNSSKYADFGGNEEIPYDEDIQHEMLTNNKVYQCAFYYIDDDRDQEKYARDLLQMLSDYLSPEDQEQVLALLTTINGLPEEEQHRVMAQMLSGDEETSVKDPEKVLLFLFTAYEKMKELADGCVWFTIHRNYGQYNIGLYYDNQHNQSHGEDL